MNDIIPNVNGGGESESNPGSTTENQRIEDSLTRKQIEADPHRDAEELKKETPTGRPKTNTLSGGGLFFDRVLKIGVGLVVFLVPLFYFFSSDVIEVSKGLLLSTLALLVLLAWVGKVISTGTTSYRKTWLLWPALGVALVVFISTFFSPSLWASFLGDVGRVSFSTVSILSYIVVLLAVLQNFNRKDALLTILAGVLSVFIATLVSLFQFLGVFILPGSFASNNLFNPVGSVFALSLFAAFSIPMLIELFIGSRKIGVGVKVALGVATLLQLFVVLAINFRTAWLVLAISLLLYLAFVIFKQGFFAQDWRKQSNITIPLVVLIISVLFWVLPGLSGPRIVNTPAEISPSYGASLGVLKGSWSDNPLLGSGPEAFTYSYAAYKSADLNQTNFWGVNFNSANAEIITWFSNFGILGALAWLAFVLGFIFLAFRALRRSDNSFLQIGLLSSWVFILASKFFYQTSLSLEVFFWLIPVLFLVRSENIDESLRLGWYEFKAKSVTTLAAFVLSVVLLVASIGGLYLNIQRWVGESSYASAFTSDGTAETRDEVLASVANAINLNAKEARYHRVFGQILINKVSDIVAQINARPSTQRQATQEESTQIQNLTVQALNTFGEAIRLDPENIGLLVDVAENYSLMNNLVGGANDLAISVYESAVKLEPINPFLKTQLARAYLVRDNFFLDRRVRGTDSIEQAKEQLSTAISLNPNYSNARYFMGFVRDREGDRAGALENFQIVLNQNPDDQVIQVVIRNLQSGLPALGIPPKEDLQNPIEDSAQGIPQ